MLRAYRYRLYPTDDQIYPTDDQRRQMTRIVGCCRFTWNRLLEYCGKSYERRKESHTAFDLNNFIAHTLKPAYPWLADAPAQTLQCVSADLTSAFKAFFRKDAAYPRFKTKHRSKKSKGSENWKKLKTEIAVLHEKIADIRKDSIHKMTKRIVCDSQADVIVIEDLNVSGMMSNHKLSKHVQDASFYEVRRQIEYKCLWYGKTLIIADRFFASSRTCSNCGWHNDGLTLRDREWECPVCHTRHDRDRNADMNLASFGLKALTGNRGRRRSEASGDALCGRPCGDAPEKHGIREGGKGPWILHGSL